MSALSIYTESGRQQATLRDFTCIAATLAELGIQFERWHLAEDLPEEVDQQQILDTYQGSIDFLAERFSLNSVNVVNLIPDHPGNVVVRNQFIDEHTHEEFGVRFFIEGDGLLYFHIDNKVYLLLCEKGDLICLPENVAHWFDIGESPNLKCLHFCVQDKGCQCEATGSRIAERFPSYDEYKQQMQA